MGCGQSKIHLYPRKSKSKANGKKGGHADSDAETDEDEGHIEDTEKYQSREREKNDDAEEESNKDTPETDEEVSVSLLRAKNLSLLQSQEISTSQQNFFRMLDKKIEEGPDYDSASETEIALEEARLNALVQHWESASLTASICSSASRSLQTTPVRQAPPKPLGAAVRIALQPSLQQAQHQQQLLNPDFLPHGASQAAPLLTPPVGVGPLKLTPNQQIAISQMNTKMLQQMTVVPSMQPLAAMSPMGMPPDTVATTANTSNNALALLQPPANQAQFAHLLALPAGSSTQQLLGKPNVSPKRIIDARLLMSASPIAKQMQPQLQMQVQVQNQYIPTTAISSAAAAAAFANGGGSSVGGGRSPQPMQMAYFGPATTATQQNMQTVAQNEQQQQQQQLHLQQQQQQQLQLPLQQQQTPQSQGQNQPYYGDVVHSVQAPVEYRFPPAISVQRLAPQVQRQIRETQELIKDSCPQLYAAGYGSPGPPIRNQARNPTRRPTLETQFSQELS